MTDGETTSHEVDLTPTPLLCRFGIHVWSKWKSTTVAYAGDPDSIVSGQARTCFECNKQQVRTIL